jgi:hypothetical protein
MNIQQVLALVDGKKTHIGAGLGLVVVLAHHFLGINVPGVAYDDTQWLAQSYTLLMVMAGRSALAKVGNGGK